MGLAMPPEFLENVPEGTISIIFSQESGQTWPQFVIGRIPHWARGGVRIIETIRTL